MKDTNRHDLLYYFNIASMLIMVVMVPIVLRMEAYSQTPYGVGWDAYYYILQWSTWVEEGRMHSPEASLIFPYMRMFSFSQEYEYGYKLSVAALTGIFALVMFLYGFIRTKRGEIALLMAAAAWFSPHLTWFAAQYPKNLLGIIFFILLLGSIASKRKYPIIIGSMLLLTYLTHRMMFNLSLVALGLYVFFEYGTRFFRNIFNPKGLSILDFTPIVLLLCAIYFVPGLFHYTDLDRFEGVFSNKPSFSPASFLIDYYSQKKISGWWTLEIVFSIGILLVAVLSFLQQELESTEKTLLWLCFILLFPFYEWNYIGISYRFFLIFVLLTPLFVAPRMLTTLHEIPMYSKAIYLDAAILMFCAAFSWKSYQPSLHDPNYDLFHKIAADVYDKTESPQKGKPELLIAHKSLAEYISWENGIATMSWLPEYPIDSTKLWRIAADVEPFYLDKYLKNAPTKNYKIVGTSYIILPEYHWQSYLRTIHAANNANAIRDVSTWRNPDRVRPSYLLRKKDKMEVSAE